MSPHALRSCLACLLASSILFAPPAPADDSIAAAAPRDAGAARPRIGLVLAGGGAKGGAHVGVLKVLEEMNVPIDCIAGTSMGALVGAGYASGIPAKDLQTFVTTIDWKSVVGGLGERDLQPIEEKRSGVTYSNQLELGLRDGQVIMPPGLVKTAGIEDLLRSYVANARMQSSFDRLPIPYRAVATDMITGEMVVIGSGDLATAMRASMAIPGAFAPVVTDKHILSDGGLVRNIPVDVARNLCADVVIVVDLVEPAADPAKLQSATQLMGRSTDVMIVANERLQLQTLTERDVLISVPMGDIGTADFERIPETIPLGETAARAAAERLATLALPRGEYLAWRGKVTSSQAIDAQVAEVRYEGLTRVNPEFLASRAEVKPGDKVDTQTLSAEAQRTSALHEMESVAYRLTGDPAAPTLEWLPQEKRWGPDYLKFDFGMYASEGGDLAFVLYGKHTRSWVNELGAEWRNEVQLGYENMLVTSFYQPLDTAQRFFVEPRIALVRTWEDVYLDEERIGRYRFSDVGGTLDFGVNLGNYAQGRLGYLFTRREASRDTGSLVLPEGDANDAGLMAQFTWDSRDTPFNATRGVAASLEYVLSDESVGADRDWQRIEAGLGVALPVRRDVIWLTMAGGSALGTDLPTDRAFSLGGPSSFPGYELGERRSREYWTVSGSYLWKVKDILSIRGQALYVGARLQAGQFYDRISEVDGALAFVDDSAVYGGSVYLTGRTFIGPLTVGVGVTSTDAWSLWIAIGRPVGHGTILEKGVFR
ncbi:MAG: patatin-like phospholipase family protein [Steroidobacteraceae bacterium]|nr:patatin-like phospholipase family protein [Steroidobacteraceae bacterium]